MTDFIWFFIIYSFLGFLLEVAFARVTHAAKKDRKCFFLLPLCPVYGAGALAILLLPNMVKGNPLSLLVLGAVASTAAEFFVGLFYEKVLKVKFWDYSRMPGNLGGKVCLLFTGFWGGLALALVYVLHPPVSMLVQSIPDFLLLSAVPLLLLDGAFTIRLLRLKEDTGALRWYLGFGAKPSRLQP